MLQSESACQRRLMDLTGGVGRPDLVAIVGAADSSGVLLAEMWTELPH